MRIAGLLFQKNERHYLEPWLAYHSWLFGLENLFVFDNGSTDEKVLATLRRYEAMGLWVDYSRNSPDDLQWKGTALAGRIRELDASDPRDFYFPLDCDEFVAVVSNGRPSISRERLERVLEPLMGDPRVLEVDSNFENNPLHADFYYRVKPSRKTFFAKGACLDLDEGYHLGKAVTTEERHLTPICYVHQHNRSYEGFRYFALQKLLPSVPELTKAELRRLVRLKQRNNHVVGRFLGSREDYYADFAKRDYVRFPDLHGILATLGAPLPVDDGSEYPEIGEIPEGVDKPDPPQPRKPWPAKRARRQVQRLIDVLRGKHRRKLA